MTSPIDAPQPMTAREALEQAARICEKRYEEELSLAEREIGVTGFSVTVSFAAAYKEAAKLIRARAASLPAEQKFSVEAPGCAYCMSCPDPKCPAKKPAVPEGYVLVPKEPTEAMFRAGDDASFADTKFKESCKWMRRLWKAMLAAAPSQPNNAAPQGNLRGGESPTETRSPPSAAAPSEKPGEAPTPRTDAASCLCVGEGYEGYECCSAAVARQLERELVEAQEIANRETLSAAYWKDKAQYATQRSVWQRGIEDGITYLRGSTFSAQPLAVQTLDACLALLRSLKDNELWGPRAPVASGADQRDRFGMCAASSEKPGERWQGALTQRPQSCACRFEWREIPDFSGHPPKQLEECGFHYEQRKRLEVVAQSARPANWQGVIEHEASGWDKQGDAVIANALRALIPSLVTIASDDTARKLYYALEAECLMTGACSGKNYEDLPACVVVSLKEVLAALKKEVK